MLVGSKYNLLRKGWTKNLRVRTLERFISEADWTKNLRVRTLERFISEADWTKIINP